MKRSGAWAIALALLTILPSGQAGSSTLDAGVYTFDDVLLVGVNDTLTIGAGAILRGRGHIEVWGALLIEGTPEARAEVALPILLLGNGTSRFEHARFWGVPGTAILLEEGRLEGRNLLVEGNVVGMVVGGNASARLENVTFRLHEGAALQARNGSQIHLRDSALLDNERGLSVRSTSDLLVEDTLFRGNGDHIAIDLAAGMAAQGPIRLARNDLGPTSLPGLERPALLLKAEPALGPDGDVLVQRVESEGNRVHGNAVGARILGAGIDLHSRNDTFVDNRVGVSVLQARVRLEGTVLGNVEDVEGGGAGNVELVNVTRLSTAEAPAPASPDEAQATLTQGFLVAVALLLLGGIAYILLRPHGGVLRTPPPEPEPVSVPVEAPADPAPALPPSPSAADPLNDLSDQERRIVEDIAAHPGSAQAAIAGRLGLSRQALHYHVKKLEARGIVQKVAKGRETRCHLAPGLEARLEQEPRYPTR